MTSRSESHTTIRREVLDEWTADLERFYPNTGDQVIEWRRAGARAIFAKIYDAGVSDGEANV